MNGPGPKISVALCTFNGAKFLPQQLQSIAAQSRPPDELIVFDDGSTDQTLELLGQFSPGFPLEIHTNASPLGPARNFQSAVAACNGDVIALCDQDDLWMNDKLAVIESQFRRQSELGLAFSDAEMCDAAGNSLGYRLWQSVGLIGRQRRMMEGGNAFEVILRQNVVTGATLAFSASLRSLLLPIDDRWMHDGWIALLASAVSPVAAIDRPLIRYRRHPAQAIGAERRSLYQQYLNAKKMERDVFARQAEMFQAALERLSAAGVAPARVDLLRRKIRHCQTRSAIRLGQRRRFPASAVEFLSLRYRRFSLGWKSFAQDLFL